MPTANCPHCAADHYWSWQEAFNKFGFNDGDGLVMTDQIADVLRAAGYTVTVKMWGMHNTVITSIAMNGVELIPTDLDYRNGDPSGCLPAAIVTLLDEHDWDSQDEEE